MQATADEHYANSPQARVKRLLTADRQIVLSPTVVDVTREVNRLASYSAQTRGAVILEGIDGEMMLVDHDPDHGYYVVAQHHDEANDMVLIDVDATQEFIECRIGARRLSLPRYMFVTCAQALRAAEHFALYGERWQRAEWRDAFALLGSRL